MNNLKFVVVFLILIVAIIIGFNSYLPERFDSSTAIKVTDFPMTIGDWNATEMKLSERDYEILETRNLFVRDYKNSKGDSVYLYLIYSQDNRKVSHPPEVCYLGSGVTIADKSPVTINNHIDATKLILEKADVRQMVVYWFKAGKMYTDHYLKQQVKIVTDRIFGKRTSGL